MQNTHILPSAQWSGRLKRVATSGPVRVSFVTLTRELRWQTGEAGASAALRLKEDTWEPTSA